MTRLYLKPASATVALALLAAVSRVLSAPSVSPSEEMRHAELPNFHRVDDHLFRGGQPDQGGVAKLKELGVRTIINLRYERELVESERVEAGAAGLQYFSVPMYGLFRPTDEQVARVLALIDDPANWPVFVHCRRGADRTGVIVACHRISKTLWTAARAIREADDLGMRKLEFAKRSFIRDFPALPTSGQSTALVSKQEPAR